MSYLVTLFNQVQFGNDTGVLGEFAFTDVEEFFYAVLDSAVYFAFVENGSEAFKDGIYAGGCRFCQYLSALDSKVTSQLD